MRRLAPVLGAVLAMGLLTAAGGANPLAAELGRTRPVVLVAPSGADPAAAALARALAQPAVQAAFAERQIVVFTVLAGQGARAGAPLTPGQTAGLLGELGLRADGPATTVLIGKDGGVKLRRAALPVAEILATIDQMPMRRAEMGRDPAEPH